jgi:hypothetical protein
LESYIDALSDSDLFLQWGALAALFSASLFVNHLLHKKALALYAAQKYVTGDSLTDAEKRWGWVLPFGQFAYGAAVFIVAMYAGGAVYTFLVGGLLVLVLSAAAHNARAILYYRMLGRPGAVQGTLWISTPTQVRSRAHFYFEIAFICLFAGLLIPHTALLGGAFFMSAGGIGYLRRARRAGARL